MSLPTNAPFSTETLLGLQKLMAQASASNPRRPVVGEWELQCIGVNDFSLPVSGSWLFLPGASLGES